MFKPVALGAAALVLSISAAPASASVLASASLDIVSLIWYTAAGVPINTVPIGVPPSPGQDTRSFSGFDEVDLKITSPVEVDLYDAVPVANPRSNFDLQCLGADCLSNPSDAPQIVSGSQYRTGYYVAVGGNAGLSGGVSASVSLPGEGVTVDTEGDVRSEWFALSSLRALRSFQSYFEITFQAQTLAHQSADAFESSASSTLFVTINFNGGPITAPINDTWVEVDLASLAGANDTDDNRDNRVAYRSGIFDVFDTFTYKLDIKATATATALTTALPVVPVPWLFLPGLVWLMAYVRLVGQPTRTRAAASLVA